MYIEYSLRGLLNALFRHKVKILLVAGLTVLAGLFFTLTIKSAYVSNATLLVNFGKDAVPTIDRSNDGGASEVSNRKEIMRSYIRLFLSRDLLLPVVKEIGADNIYPPQETDGTTITSHDVVKRDPDIAAAMRLSGDIEVSADTQSNVIEVRVRSHDAPLSVILTEKLVKTFIRNQNDVYSVSEANFLDEQIQGSQDKLSVAQANFLKFKQLVGISSLDKEMDVLLSEKSTLTGMAFSAMSQSQNELAELKAKEAEMRVTYNARSPLLTSLQNRIRVLETIVEKRTTELLASESDGGTLASKLANIDERIQYLESKRPEYEQFSQVVESKQKDFDYLKNRGEDARINEMLRQMNITRISVIEKPILPTQTTSVNKKLLLMAFIILGGILALAVAILVELLDDTIASAEAAELGTKLPVLVSFDYKEKAVTL